ncbi:MAG: trypsin-like peptidase domain-containing protein [Thermoprotei archaeon]
MSSLTNLSRELAGIVEKVRDSIITIATQRIELYDLFYYKPAISIGSGFAIAPRYAITNAHVVRGAERVRVIYSDGVSGEGLVIASDPSRDLALVELDRRLKPLPMGDSDKLSVGEIVLAIGSPLGLPGPSVTLGVVSALGRTIIGENIVLEDLIQTDAAINPGNSGGPIVNTSGEAIGVATAIIPYAQGIGFAIPINTVKRFIHLIEKYGRPVRAWIGVYVAQVTKNLARMYNLPVDHGVVVVRVVPGSPAYEAGIEEGDIIVEASGKHIEKIRDLKNTIEDNIETGYIDLVIIRGQYRYRVRVPIVVE